MAPLDLTLRFRTRAPHLPVSEQAAALDWRPVTLEKPAETLPVAGLTRLDAVSMGNTLLPLTEQRRYPTEPSLKSHETVDEPLILLTESTSGAVLERSVLSNQGVWQAGTFYVAGDWSDAGTATAPAAKSAKAA